MVVVLVAAGLGHLRWVRASGVSGRSNPLTGTLLLWLGMTRFAWSCHGTGLRRSISFP